MLGSVSTPGSGRARGLSLDSFSAAVSSIEAADLQSRYNLSLPLHSLVSDINHSDNRPGVLTTHVWQSAGPIDGFYRVMPELYVCSPELMFLQMAQSLTVQELIQLGFELCGHYSLRPGGVEYSLNQLVTVNDLMRVVAAHRGLPGIVNARRALNYICDGSYSPQETALAMLLGLPYKYGGASFGMPVMNHPIELSVQAQGLLGQRTCKCDLFYQDCRLDLEYESYEFHSNSGKMEHDSLRRDALALDGINVLTVTNKQVRDQRKLDALIRLVSKISGKRFRPQCDGYRLRQQRLIDILAQ